MNKFVLIIISEFMLYLVLMSASIFAYPEKKERESLYPHMTSVPPLIDGELDDESWDGFLFEKEFITYNPIYGEVFPQKTLIWMTYDSKNLYFAFMCYDTEPQKIKTSVTKRDNIFNDDWVGLSLDALGNRQSSYDLFVNPSGIQGDILTSVAAGEDLSPDFVWESAGRITEEGYQVEICIPLRSIRYKEGEEVKMGIIFWRRISRLGMSGSWPEMKPGYKVFEIHAALVYKNLKSHLKFEILPGVTLGTDRERINPDSWGENDSFSDFGVGLKYGITSSMTADLTINPDFSQVESDAFQVEVNQRYPLFYSEKRPFFMEGMEVFDFTTSSFAFLGNPVHTRRIVNPNWGVKVTGTSGNAVLGILSAEDDVSDLSRDSANNFHNGRDANFTIARGKYSIGRGDYIGCLYSGREFSGEYNRVIGMDFGYRIIGNHRISGSFLESISREGEEKISVNNPYINFLYLYMTRPFGIAVFFEHLGKDFRMDSSFLKRSANSNGGIYLERNIYPSMEKMPWLIRIRPTMIYHYIHDLNTSMDDKIFKVQFELNFVRQGFLNIRYFETSESWKNRTFNLTDYNMDGGVQINKWLRLRGFLRRSEKIYYYSDPSYKGFGYDGEFYFKLQPNVKFSQSFQFSYSDFRKDRDKVYDVKIANSQTTYQFNRYFFIRGIVQYNSYQERVVTDFLASFTLIPGTVIHAGYGGLYEKRGWSGNGWEYGRGDFLNIKRSFFFKTSYLWRF